MKNNNDTLLLKIYLPFLLFIVVPMLFLNGATFTLLSRIKESDYSKNLSQTQTVGAYFSNVLSESIAVSRKLLFDSDINKLAYVKKEKNADDHSKIRAADNLLNQYAIGNSDKYAHNVYYDASSILLSTVGTCSNLDYFYGNSYSFGEQTLNDLSKQAQESDSDVLFKPFENFVLNSSRYDGFYYTTALNPSSSQQNKGLIISIINKGFIDKAFSPLNTDGSFTYVTDIKGNVLFISGSPSCEIKPYLPTQANGYVPKELYGSSYSVSYVCLPEGVNILNVKPSSIIVRNTQMLTMLVFLLNIVCVIICIIAATYIAVKRRKKLRKTFSMLDMAENNSNSDFYDSINHGIATLLNRNQDLSANLSRDVFILRYEFWQKLLGNSFSCEEELRLHANHADIQLDSDYYCIIVLSIRQHTSEQGLPDATDIDWSYHIPETNEIKEYRSNLLDNIESKIALNGYVYNASVQQTVLLLKVSENEIENYKELVLQIMSDIPPLPENVTLDRTGGRLFSNIINAYDEYTYCNNVLLQFYDTLISENSEFVWNDGEYTRNENFKFPQKLSDSIVASIKAGDHESVKSCLRKVLNDNFNSSSILTDTISNLLITKLKLAVMEAYQEGMGFDLHESFRSIDSLPFDASKFSYFIDVTNKMCDYYKSNIEQKAEKLRRKIVDYVSENVTKPSFSLTEVAEHCGFSDSYFSVLFREILGINFSTYVEKKKMDFADNLLRNSSLKVDEIAQRTGYSDANAFRRAYKKYFSVSPCNRRKDS